MQFDQISATVTVFIQTHQLISIAALAIAAFFFYKSPKESFKFLAFLTILAIAGYFIIQLGGSADSGIKNTKEMNYKTKKALGE